jgi:hypothetical protein
MDYLMVRRLEPWKGSRRFLSMAMVLCCVPHPTHFWGFEDSMGAVRPNFQLPLLLAGLFVVCIKHPPYLDLSIW